MNQVDELNARIAALELALKDALRALGDDDTYLDESLRELKHNMLLALSGSKL